MSNIIEIIKKVALDAIEESNPCTVLYGTVTGINPLKINIEQRLTLDKDHLLLTDNVKDYDVDVTNIKGKQKVTIHNDLKIGEKVLLLRIQGGQKYLVLDRVIG